MKREIEIEEIHPGDDLPVCSSCKDTKPGTYILRADGLFFCVPCYVGQANDIRKERDRIKTVLCQSEPLILLDEYFRVFGRPEEGKNFFIDVLDEVSRARKKFPDPALLLTAFAEEAGEVVKAGLEHYHGMGDPGQLEEEIIQAAAMLVRLLEEGDPVHKIPGAIPKGDLNE